MNIARIAIILVYLYLYFVLYIFYINKIIPILLYYNIIDQYYIGNNIGVVIYVVIYSFI